MPFIAALKKNVINNGSHAFDRRLDFEEMDVLEENKKLILLVLILKILLLLTITKLLKKTLLQKKLERLLWLFQENQCSFVFKF